MNKVAAVLLLVGAGSSVVAELPPMAYQEMQRTAPEALAIRVLSVKTVARKCPEGTNIAVTVVARVATVERSASDLRPGMRITIVYKHCRRDRAIFGASEVPILEKGKSCVAFLEQDGAVYHPAAGGFSFHRVP